MLNVQKILNEGHALDRQAFEAMTRSGGFGASVAGIAVSYLRRCLCSRPLRWVGTVPYAESPLPWWRKWRSGTFIAVDMYRRLFEKRPTHLLLETRLILLCHGCYRRFCRCTGVMRNVAVMSLGRILMRPFASRLIIARFRPLQIATC